MGLPVDYVRMSLRDNGAGYLGTEQQWRDAEAALRHAADRVLPGTGLELVDGVGEAAFYGPKLDLQVRDGRGHEETIATVQLDFNQPERFDLTYDGEDGGRHRVAMIHRGTVGSMERVVASLLERYQGRLPLWLAPVQVCLLPVAPEHDAAARRLHDDLLAAGLRPRTDVDGSLGARIRRSRERRDALIAVIGDAEAASDTVQVTDPAADYRGAVDRARFVGKVREAYEHRAVRVAW